MRTMQATRTTRAGHRRRVAWVLVAALAVVTSGCVHLVAPEGDEPLRYRDDVFTDVSVTTDIVYGTAPSQAGDPVTLRLDLYEPTGDTVTARPTIVWVHGGSFCCGSKTSPEIVDQANVFTRKGYVNASITYRLTPGGCAAGGVSPACVLAIRDAMWDGQTAVRYLRAHAEDLRIDPERIAIAGSSAGWITALNVGFSSATPGPGDHADQSSTVQAAVSLSGARIFGSANDQAAPSLLFHGDADVVVPYQWAWDTALAAGRGGALSLLTTWEGAGHVPYAAHRAQILEETRNFLYHILDVRRAAR